MWWVAFTAIDLYIGLILLDTLIPTLPERKRRRATSVKKGIAGLLLFCAIVFIALLIRRYVHS